MAKSKKRIRLDLNRIKQDLLSRYDKAVIERKLTEIWRFLHSLDDESFYNIINKCSYKKFDQLYEAISFYNYINLVVHKKATPLRALLVLFFIEGAASQEKYLEFYDWLIRKTEDDDKLDLLANKSHAELADGLASLYKTYKKDYGSRRIFKQLFKKYLKFEEKLELLRSFSRIDDNNDGFHFCYEAGRGCCDYRTCYLLHNNDNIDSYIERIADMLHSMRSDFAHGNGVSSFTFTPKEDYLPLLISYYNKQLLEVRLAHSRFEDLAQRMVCRYLLAQQGK